MTAHPAVLDMTVASFLVGGRPQAELFRDDLAPRLIFLPFLAEAELLAGAHARSWGVKKRHALAQFLAKATIVDSDREVSRAWSELRASTRTRGVEVETADLWIAAIALATDAVLFTHDAGFRKLPGALKWGCRG